MCGTRTHPSPTVGRRFLWYPGSSSATSCSSPSSSCSSSIRTTILARATTRSSLSVSIRPASTVEYWPIADCHCKAFYPYIRIDSIWDPLLRLDRVVSLVVGREREDVQHRGRFLCLVATTKSSMLAAQGCLAHEDEGDENEESSLRQKPLSHWIIEKLAKSFLPEKAKENYATSAAESGVVGAVVVDTLGDHVPPRRRPIASSSSISTTVSPLGVSNENAMLARTHIAYLSNLAVLPSSRRQKIGERLVREAEQIASDWGCRSMALHVDPENDAAVKLYQRLGYRFVARESNTLAWFEGRRPLALMVRLLPRS